ncbi:unnamed protein product [Merluccius merluccius]
MRRTWTVAAVLLAATLMGAESKNTATEEFRAILDIRDQRVYKDHLDPREKPDYPESKGGQASSGPGDPLETQVSASLKVQRETKDTKDPRGSWERLVIPDLMESGAAQESEGLQGSQEPSGGRFLVLGFKDIMETLVFQAFLEPQDLKVFFLGLLCRGWPVLLVFLALRGIQESLGTFTQGLMGTLETKGYLGTRGHPDHHEGRTEEKRGTYVRVQELGQDCQDQETETAVSTVHPGFQGYQDQLDWRGLQRLGWLGSQEIRETRGCQVCSEILDSQARKESPATAMLMENVAQRDMKVTKEQLEPQEKRAPQVSQASQEVKVPWDLWASPVIKNVSSHQDHRGRTDTQVSQLGAVLTVTLGRRATKGCQGLVGRALQGSLGTRGWAGCPCEAILDPRAPGEKQGSLVHQVCLVLMDSVEIQEPSDPKEGEELMDSQAPLAKKVTKGCPVSLAYPVQRGTRVKMVYLDLQDRRGRLAQSETPVLPAYLPQETLDQKETGARWGLRAPKDHQGQLYQEHVLMDQKETLVSLATLVFQKSTGGIEETQVLLGPQASLGPVEIQALLALQGQEPNQALRGLAVILVLLDTKGPLVPQAPKEHRVVVDSFLIAKHSQNTSVPGCPPGATFIYDGYSLLFINANEKAHGQDLGSMGSCLPRFSTMPYLFCDTENSCRYAARNDYSYWLSTDEPVPPSMVSIAGAELATYISRCSVCETTSNMIAVHSQSTIIPECPGNWESLWTGYSFVMQSGAGAAGSSQPLVSPGSCLEHFRQVPFIECHGRGTCNYYLDSYSYWLAALYTHNIFSKPEARTVKGESLQSVISRCRVCRKPWQRSGEAEH